VLSGGGARGAYQVGVLCGLADLGLFRGGRMPFDVLVGASAGAINAAMLAANADRMDDAIGRLAEVWTHLRAEQVIRTDLRSLTGIGARWVRDLSFGGVFGRVAPKSLLDTSPLRKLLRTRIPFERIDHGIASGAIRALAVLATDLYTSQGVVFVHGAAPVRLWQRSWSRVEGAAISADHVMASSAIPLFFPSVEIAGRHYGDGCIRNTAPLSPAINLGADRIVAIGVRAPERSGGPTYGAGKPPPTVAQIAGVLLDAVMLDAIEVDIEHSGRVNASVVVCPEGRRGGPFRWIDVLWLRPSRSIGRMAAEMAGRIPRIVRYLMRGLGSDESTTELASYLLFDEAFCRRLIDLGRADVADRRADIETFFSMPSESAPGSR
jgi:NTE family protein